MRFRLLADAVVVLHLAFVLFVGLGGLLVVRRPRLAWMHLPAVVWGAWIEFSGWTCPLTPFENWLREQGGDAAYTASFVDQVRDAGRLSGVVIAHGYSGCSVASCSESMRSSICSSGVGTAIELTALAGAADARRATRPDRHGRCGARWRYGAIRLPPPTRSSCQRTTARTDTAAATTSARRSPGIDNSLATR